jgi:hypothetical protein
MANRHGLPAKSSDSKLADENDLAKACDLLRESDFILPLETRLRLSDFPVAVPRLISKKRAMVQTDAIRSGDSSARGEFSLVARDALRNRQ